MMVLIIQHAEAEGPGLVEEGLRRENIYYQIINLRPGAQFPNLDNLTHIVILGGPMNVHEEDRYPFLKGEDLFIKEAIQRGRFVLGICLGAQLIAKALGARVTKSPVKEIGWYDVSLTKNGSMDPLFSHLPKTFSVFQWHEDTFDIPHHAIWIATSSLVPHQAFRYGDNAYGLQFHVEVTQAMVWEWMETYEEKFEGSHPPLLSKQKIIADTELKIELYQKRGEELLRNFFNKSLMGGMR